MSDAELSAYYRAVAPFYEREMRLREDLDEWRALARAAAPRTALDLGAGYGRLAEALHAELPSLLVVELDACLALRERRRRRTPFVQGDMRALPLHATFDLVAAANDPFAHLLEDGERVTAVREASRVLAPGGRLVIDGLWLTPHDAGLARSGALERERELGDGVIARERWRAASDDVYEVTYEYRGDGRRVAEARTLVRAWRADEPAVRECGARVAGSLDGRAFVPSRSRFVVLVGGGE